MLQASAYIEQNKSLPPDLVYALLRGTSVGGARPKALIEDNGKNFIAKFSLNTDTFNVIKAEYLGMRLAKLVGLNVPNVTIRQALGKDILMVERFDRSNTNIGMTRHLMLSGLTLLNLNELEARYASYLDLAEIIRQQFEMPKNNLLELYKRLVFNILIGNTDDHARNHSAFWNGITLNLTPAYDLCPQPRMGQEATQAMAMRGSQGNFSTLINAQSISQYFQISSEDAYILISEMINTLKNHWTRICEEADLSMIERNRLWGSCIFNPFCFSGWK